MISPIEELLLNEDYMFYTKGNDADSPMLSPTGRFKDMMRDLYEEYPDHIITEGLILQYVNRHTEKIIKKGNTN